MKGKTAARLLTKTVSFTAAAAIMFALSAPAFAAVTVTTAKPTVTKTPNDNGTEITVAWDFSNLGTEAALTSEDETADSTYDAGENLSFTKVTGAGAAIYANGTITTADSVGYAADVYGKNWLNDTGTANRYAKYTAPADGTFSFTIYSNTTSNKNKKYRAYYTSSSDDTVTLPSKDSDNANYSATTQIPSSGNGTNGSTIEISMTKGYTYIITLHTNSSDNLVGMSNIKFAYSAETHEEGYTFEITSKNVADKVLTVVTNDGTNDKTTQLKMSDILTTSTEISGNAELNLAIIFKGIPTGTSIKSATIE